MYKINLYYKSNIIGVYTKEEEISTDITYLKLKIKRMLNRWFNILCPHIDLDKYIDKVLMMKRYINNNELNPEYLDEINKIQINLIKQTLDEMDKFDEYISGIKTTDETKRQFIFTIQTIE